MSDPRFTPDQRRVLISLAGALALVFGVLGFAVFTTSPFRRTSSVGSTNPSPLSPVTTPTVVSPIASPSPAATPIPTPAAPLSPIQSARFVQEVGQIVAGMRELPPVEQIPVTFPTAHELALTLLQRYQEEQPQEELALYTDLGLIPALDPPPLPDVSEQAAHILSLYVPDEQQILLVSGRGPATTEDELAVVHALVHALQHKQFNLGTVSPCQPTTDAALALKALIEGDAVMTTARYAESESDQEEISQLARMAAGAEEPSYAPIAENAAFEQLRLFPYQEGAHLLAALYEEGEWERVNRAYARPPCSTEQVLHPGRYLAGEPVEDVALPDLGTTLGEGWDLMRRDTLGELLVGLHLAAHLESDGMAWEGADGWAGDTFELWENEEGEQVLAWRIGWDNRDEAEAFERAYALLVPRFRTPPLIVADAPYDLHGCFWEGPAGSAYLVRAGRVATVVWGPDFETLLTVAEALP